MPPHTSSLTMNLCRIILDETRTLQASLPDFPPRRPELSSVCTVKAVRGLPEPRPIASLLYSLGLTQEQATRCSSLYMRDASTLRANHESIISRVVSEACARWPHDSHVFVDELVKAERANLRRIMSSWIMHIIASCNLGSKVPENSLCKPVGPPCSDDAHDAGESSCFIEECTPEDMRSFEEPQVLEERLQVMLQGMSLGPSQTRVHKPAPLPITAMQYASRHTLQPPEPASTVLRVLPNANLGQDAFMRYTADSPATLVPRSRRRKIVALPRRTTTSMSSEKPGMDLTCLPSIQSSFGAHTPQDGTPAANIITSMPTHDMATPTSPIARRRKIAPLPIRAPEQARARGGASTPSSVLSGSPSPTTPTCGSQRFVSRTPSLASISSDDDSLSSTGPSTPTSSDIELPHVTSPFSKFSLCGGEDVPVVPTTSKGTSGFVQSASNRLSAVANSPSSMRITIPGTFVQAYGAAPIKPMIVKSIEPLQASVPKVRRTAGLPGSKRALKGLAPLTPKVLGFAAPSLPKTASESAFGTFDVRTPRAATTFNFSSAK